MKKKIFTLFLLGILTLALTGCGSKNNVIKSLNDAVQKEIDLWDEQDGHTDFTISKLQDYLTDYIFIASGDKKFTSTDGSTKYTSQMVGYKAYSNSMIMDSNSDIKYALVYDKKKEKYYSVEISYKKTKFKEKYEYDYPVFSNAQVVK